MNLLHRRTRSVALAAALAAVPFAAAAPAQAATRTAATTAYTEATYLQHALGLPASDTDPAIKVVTYDRFQWLLQQSGKYALLIGDPATDATFKTHAQEVEAAAKATGVKNVYWFDPNLSGSAKVGDITEPTLDIRNAPAIGQISTRSQGIYTSAWLNLVSYLGNGVTATVNNNGSESATITATTGNAGVANDTQATPAYDYRGGATSANVLDSYFFVYDKNASSKVKSVDLTQLSGSAYTLTAGAIGDPAGFSTSSEFSWWKDEVNFRHQTQTSSDASGKSVPVLTDADNDPAKGGWRVHQITYPELVDLLGSATDATAPILFGGTWCPNTRPVLPFVNRDAQNTNSTVWNFDTVLDGGLAGGATTSAVNPLQTRNTVSYTTGGTTTPNANPTSLYGDLVAKFLGNLKTEYAPIVTYYPGGTVDTSAAASTIRKLQVPYLVGYQGKATTGNTPVDGVNRQWIIDNGDGSYKEYMSSWAYTNPQQNQIGLTPAKLPSDAPIWSTINQQIAAFTAQTDPTTLYANTASDTDDAQFLVAADYATLTYSAATSTKDPAVTVASSTSGNANAIPVSPAALQSALTALGANAPANLAAAKAAWLANRTAGTSDANLNTVVGAWGLAQLRKNSVNAAWGSATSPASVAGGIAAVNALDVFFDGLPSVPTTGGDTGAGNGNGTGNGGDTGAQTPQNTGTPAPAVTPAPSPAPTPIAKVVAIKASKVAGAVAKAPTHAKAGTYTVKVSVPSGKAAATGKVTIKLVKGKTAKLVTGTLVKGVVTLKVPKLAKGTWTVTISWLGDVNYLAAKVDGGAIKVKK
ncbi:MAG: Ig-like domain repeat protein [Solirubrobacteraceae bacterium]|nr:hypothetical protein [Patulibacter sp.]